MTRLADLEDALIEASRMQRAAFEALFPDEAAEMRRLLGAQAPKPQTKKEDLK